jgi:hypothetical protein
MKKIYFISMLATAIVLTACSCKEDKVEPKLSNLEDLHGSWLLYEEGYSPGAGYITNPVPAEPAQYLTFSEGNAINSSIEHLKEYKHYRIIEEPVSKSNILIVYKTDPGNKEIDISELKDSFFIKFINGKLNLSNRMCIEGCHLAFKPITKIEN